MYTISQQGHLSPLLNIYITFIVGYLLLFQNLQDKLSQHLKGCPGTIYFML